MTITNQTNNEHLAQTVFWGPERCIEINRSSTENLGFSIVGGKIHVKTPESDILDVTNGIFVKKKDVSNCPKMSGELMVGDRILEVNGYSLKNSTYENAVEIIKNTGNTVKMVVQSFIISEYSKWNEIPISSREPLKDNEDINNLNLNSKRPTSEISNTPKSLSENITNSGKTNTVKESESSSESEDERFLEGNVFTKAGVEISRKSAGNVKRSQAEINADPETEDDFGYTALKVKKKYLNLGQEAMMVTVERENRKLGIFLAGHKERTKMGVFVAGFHSKHDAIKNDKLKIGDEIIEINGNVLLGRCHLNASVVIKKLPQTIMKLIVLRHKNGTENLAVPSGIHLPSVFDEFEQYNQYEGVRTLNINKGHHGLGIMIIQGKHAKLGSGIFVSDIQEGSAAEQAGLQVGDMILAVNSDTFLESTYDQATGILKQAEGIIILTVCNSSGNVEAKESKQDDSSSNPNNKGNPENPTASQGNATQGAATQDPAVNVPINDKKPLTIEISRQKDKSIGFILVGGKSTPCGGIFILDISSELQKAEDNKLKPGNRILEFNQNKFQTVDYEPAASLIFTATGTIKMTIRPGDDQVEKFDVEVTKKPPKALGVNVTSLANKSGVYISEMIAGTPATETGKLNIGDRVMEICNNTVYEQPIEDVIIMFKLFDTLTLKLIRCKAVEN